MPTVYISLKRDEKGEWRLYAPKGHEMAGPYRGSKFDAMDWARQWCSTWQEWTVVQYDEGNTNAQKD